MCFPNPRPNNVDADKIPDRRPMIIDLLRLLSSGQEQLAYEAKVPIADVPAELLCMWFDDQYHPQDPFFRSCFTAGELEALARFHEFYDQRHKSLPKSQGTVRTWLVSPVWREIMVEAKKTLDTLGPN